MYKLGIAIAFFLSGCGATTDHIYTEFLTPVCIKPFEGYRYHICADIKFIVDGVPYSIPKNFETDLATIPRIVWPIMAPAHSSLIRPAIVHDWFYRKTCIFDRHDSDLIFYHMLRNDGVSAFRASVMYYAVRWFGWPYYNEDYCDERL